LGGALLVELFMSECEGLGAVIRVNPSLLLIQGLVIDKSMFEKLRKLAIFN
jgi:hypothetical protein